MPKSSLCKKEGQEECGLENGLWDCEPVCVLNVNTVDNNYIGTPHNMHPCGIPCIAIMLDIGEEWSLICWEAS